MSSLETYGDISGHNGTPDLHAYWNAGHRFLMFKATEGTGYAWEAMPNLVRQWHSIGGRAGYYHWLYGTFSGRAQHDWFWRHVEPVFQTGDELMTDFEDVAPSRWVSDAQHLAVVREFDSLCDQHALTTDYAPNWYVAAMPLCTAYFKTRLVIASDYSHNPPLNPHGFTLAGHQFTDRASVAGFAAPIDYNRRLIPVPGASMEETMTAAEVADIKAYLDHKFQALHNELAPTVQNVKDCRGASVEIRTAVTNDSIPTRAAQYVTGALALPAGQSGVNVPGVKAAVTASATDVKAHLDTALASHMGSAAGAADLQPVLAAIAQLPAAIRTELARGLSE